LAHIISCLTEGSTLDDAVEAALKLLRAETRGRECVIALEQAMDLARERTPSPEAVESLGAGWVAEEALAIAVYCSMVADDFRSGVLLAVNHSGDSDSTGSIAGQILGTMLGVEAIPQEWVDVFHVSRR
jgi:ADP-ribosylglycohydrolase